MRRIDEIHDTILDPAESKCNLVVHSTRSCADSRSDGRTEQATSTPSSKSINMVSSARVGIATHVTKAMFLRRAGMRIRVKLVADCKTRRTCPTTLASLDRDWTVHGDATKGER